MPVNLLSGLASQARDLTRILLAPLPTPLPDQRRVPDPTLVHKRLQDLKHFCASDTRLDWSQICPSAVSAAAAALASPRALPPKRAFPQTTSSTDGESDADDDELGIFSILCILEYWLCTALSRFYAAYKICHYC